MCRSLVSADAVMLDLNAQRTQHTRVPAVLGTYSPTNGSARCDPCPDGWYIKIHIYITLLWLLTAVYRVLSFFQNGLFDKSL